MTRLREAVESEDLLDYGFIPELIGRLPVVVGLQGLDKDSLVRVAHRAEERGW